MVPAVTFSAADLQFDADRHEYSLPDGRIVPSVTQILRAVGVSTDFEQIGGMSSEHRATIEHARALGTAVHADCHAFDDRDLDLDQVHPDVRPYLDAWVTFRENTGFVPDVRERRVFHPFHFYCGTLDAIGSLPNGQRVLVDIKTGNPDDAGAQYQTAGYVAAYLIDHDSAAALYRWSVQLRPECEVPYRLSPYDDWLDFQKFAAFVTTYSCQAARRRAR